MSKYFHFPIFPSLATVAFWIWTEFMRAFSTNFLFPRRNFSKKNLLKWIYHFNSTFSWRTPVRSRSCAFERVRHWNISPKDDEFKQPPVTHLIKDLDAAFSVLRAWSMRGSDVPWAGLGLLSWCCCLGSCFIRCCLVVRIKLVPATRRCNCLLGCANRWWGRQAAKPPRMVGSNHCTGGKDNHIQVPNSCQLCVAAEAKERLSGRIQKGMRSSVNTGKTISEVWGGMAGIEMPVWKFQWAMKADSVLLLRAGQHIALLLNTLSAHSCSWSSHHVV